MGSMLDLLFLVCVCKFFIEQRSCENQPRKPGLALSEPRTCLHRLGSNTTSVVETTTLTFWPSCEMERVQRISRECKCGFLLCVSGSAGVREIRCTAREWVCSLRSSC